MTISQSDVHDFIVDLAKNHPEYSMEQFKNDFNVVLSREPTFTEIRIFQKSVFNAKLMSSPISPLSSSSFTSVSSSSSASVSPPYTTTPAVYGSSYKSPNIASPTYTTFSTLSASNHTAPPSVSTSACTASPTLSASAYTTPPILSTSAYTPPILSASAHIAPPIQSASAPRSPNTSPRAAASFVTFPSTSSSSRPTYTSLSISPDTDTPMIEVVSSFRQNPKGGYTLKKTPVGEMCSFTCDCYRTIFLASAILEGIFRWTVIIKYSREKSCVLSIGAAPTNRVHFCEEDKFGKTTGTCCFAFWREVDGRLQSGLHGVVGEEDIPPSETRVPDDSLVAIEMDTRTHVLSFSVNERKVPRDIAHVYGPLYFGISGCYNPSFTSVSFRRLSVPTPSIGPCKSYESMRTV